MAQGWLQLLKQPGAYFEAFNDGAPSWKVAYAGFYLMTFVEGLPANNRLKPTAGNRGAPTGTD